MSAEQADNSRRQLEPGSQAHIDAANRATERWLGIDLNAPRPDQKGTDSHLYTTPHAPHSRHEDEEVACIIVYNDAERTIKYLRPDGQEYAPEITPETEK